VGKIGEKVIYLEIRLPVSGCERGLACHPERSEGSRRADSEILRFAQDDTSYLQMSGEKLYSLHIRDFYVTIDA